MHHTKTTATNWTIDYDDEYRVGYMRHPARENFQAKFEVLSNGLAIFKASDRIPHDEIHTVQLYVDEIHAGPKV